MFSTLFSALIFAQLGPLPTIEEDRLRTCLIEARGDPATAISSASSWLEGMVGAERSYPQQCLGFAYMSLLRWEAAQTAFISARDARGADDFTLRSQLGAMAGNAALAGGSFQDAEALLQDAKRDAVSAGDNAQAGQLAADRARALVALGRRDDAAGALTAARELAPQEGSVWLLSATLARRLEDLEAAQSYIQTAAALDPANPAIGLEAGVIAALSGFYDAARASWQSVLLAGEGTPEAESARAYLDQLDEEPEEL